MIGFAGLGKYLNERSLSLLKGRKKRKPYHKTADPRLSSKNKTDYDELINWQQKKRTANRTAMLIVRFALVASILIVLIYFFLI